ncbi:MAG: MFS transporter [Chlamydiales bacterium]
MSSLLRQFFNLYPGEGRRAKLFALLAYLWSVALTSGIKFSDALFLVNVGPEDLPKAYFFTACGLLISALFLLSAVHHLAPIKIYLYFTSFGFVFFGFSLLSYITDIFGGSEVYWYSLKVVSGSLFNVIFTAFWILADEHYHIQDAKRVFALFTVTVFIGNVTTGGLMRSGLFTVPILLIFIMVLLAMSVLVALYIAKTTTKVSDEKELDIVSDTEFRSVSFLLRSILSSRFTILLMSFNFLMQLMIYTTEFNYYTAFVEYFGIEEGMVEDSGTDSPLTRFLGQWIATVGIFNIIVGGFIYSRLVRRFGVNNLVIVTPAVLFFAFIGWKLGPPILFFPLIGFFVVEGSVYVFEDNNFSLFLNAVPNRVKYKIRVLIESFFEPIGIMLSSILLSFFSAYSIELSLTLSVCWLSVAFGVRSQYLNALFSNLWENVLHTGITAKSWFATLRPKTLKKVEHRLVAIVRYGNDEAALFAIEALIAADDRQNFYKALPYTNEMEVDGKLSFIKLIEESQFDRDQEVIELLRKWAQKETDSKLQHAVAFYLAKQGFLQPEKVISDLESQQIEDLGVALVTLKKSVAYQNPRKAAYNLTLAAQRLEELLDSENEAELSMGLKVLGCESSPANVDILIPYLNHGSLRVARTAAHSIEQIIDRHSLRHASKILRTLSLTDDKTLRMSCLKSLGKFGDSSLVRPIIELSVHFRASEKRKVEEIIRNIGLRTIPTLITILQDDSLHYRSRILAGRVLGSIALPQLLALLYEIIQTEIDRAWFYYVHAVSIPQKYPNTNLEILTQSLYSSYFAVLDFVIQLLGSAGAVENTELIIRSLRNEDPKIRGQAMEALEKSIETKLYQLLHPLIGELPIEEKLKHFPGEELSLSALLDQMEQAPSLADRIIALTVKYQLDFPQWRNSLKQQMLKNANEEMFHHFAYELLET